MLALMLYDNAVAHQFKQYVNDHLLLFTTSYSTK